MDKLVFLENDQPLTSSRIVAEKFEKLHKNVVQAIENIKAENSALTPCYYETTYQAGTGKHYKEYLMNQKGFALLVMGFTGQKARKWQSDFYDAFEAMKNKLQQIALQRPLIRQSTILGQRKVTDAIKEYVIPNARKSGSTAPDKVFYMTYNKLFNKLANIPAGQRDNLTVSQLIMLDQMQDVAAANIRIKAKHGASYKEIYAGTKNAVEGYTQFALVQERLRLQ